MQYIALRDSRFDTPSERIIELPLTPPTFCGALQDGVPINIARALLCGRLMGRGCGTAADATTAQTSHLVKKIHHGRRWRIALLHPLVRYHRQWKDMEGCGDGISNLVSPAAGTRKQSSCNKSLAERSSTQHNINEACHTTG